MNEKELFGSRKKQRKNISVDPDIWDSFGERLKALPGGKKSRSEVIEMLIVDFLRKNMQIGLFK
jgi:predicted CopG family antitoxin